MHDTIERRRLDPARCDLRTMFGQCCAGWPMLCHVYLLASRPFGTLYLGVTRDLGRRIVEHRGAAIRGFSATYGVYRLVWMEDYERLVDAIAREKAIKKWRREWKVALIEKDNPDWHDLFHTLNC